MTTEEPQWFKSSYGGNGGQCIEGATNLVAKGDMVPVRDSKDPNGPALGFGVEAFSAFVDAVKADEFSTT